MAKKYFIADGKSVTAKGLVLAEGVEVTKENFTTEEVFKALVKDKTIVEKTVEDEKPETEKDDGEKTDGEKTDGENPKDEKPKEEPKKK